MAQLIKRMTARDTAEEHRGSTPLELLFDLTFVVAIAQVAMQLAQRIAEGSTSESVGPYVMVFFAIWWAWMNFTWFASSYDTDDVPYRVLVLVQMSGVLIIAAGVPSLFSNNDLTAVIIGYVVMRVGLISLWIRAGIQHPEGRSTAFRYAAGMAFVQLLWIGRLALPDQGPWWLFPLIAAIDLAVPLWAERTGGIAWHPHHIAERYGLFTIIVLGESVLAATIGVQGAIDGDGVSVELVTIALTGLLLLFVLWWLYFSEPAGEGLAVHRKLWFLWGYGHFAIFASLAAIGAGLEVAVASAGHPIDAGAQDIAFAVALPVAIFLLSRLALQAPLGRITNTRRAATVITTVVVLLAPLAVDITGISGYLVTTAAVVTSLLVVTVVGFARDEKRADPTTVRISHR